MTFKDILMILRIFLFMLLIALVSVALGFVLDKAFQHAMPDLLEWVIEVYGDDGTLLQTYEGKYRIKVMANAVRIEGVDGVVVIQNARVIARQK